MSVFARPTRGATDTDAADSRGTIVAASRAQRRRGRPQWLPSPVVAVALLASGALAPGVVCGESCAGKGIELQVLGSGGPELEDRRASSSYLIWRDGQPRILVDSGGGSALEFGRAGAHRMLRSLGRESQTRAAIAAVYSGPVTFADDLDCFR
jgi:hypothetical protein